MDLNRKVTLARRHVDFLVDPREPTAPIIAALQELGDYCHETAAALTEALSATTEEPAHG